MPTMTTTTLDTTVQPLGQHIANYCDDSFELHVDETWFLTF